MIDKRPRGVLLGLLVVAGMLFAVPLARNELAHVITLPDALYVGFGFTGAALGLVGLIGIALLLAPFAVVAARGGPSTWFECRPVSHSNVKAVHALLKGVFADETPSISRMLEWQRRNRGTLTALYEKQLERDVATKTLVGVFKILPLTADGEKLVAKEQRTGTTLSPRDIATDAEQTTAFYIGDVLAVTSRAKGEVLRQLKQVLGPEHTRGMPVYTRPLSRDGARLVRTYGFLPVAQAVTAGEAGRIHKLSGSPNIGREEPHMTQTSQSMTK